MLNLFILALMGALHSSYFSIAFGFYVPVLISRSPAKLSLLMKSTKTISIKTTFKRYMQVESWRHPELENLYPILCSIENSCRDINRLMRRISTDNLSGLAGGSINIQGEEQKQLDVVANRIMKTSLCGSGNVDIIASEEEDKVCSCADVMGSSAVQYKEYSAVFDPLDGSSNVDSGLPTGTIFGVYKNNNGGNGDTPEAAVMQRGNHLVVAGYCLYSAATHLLITTRHGLHQFTLDDVTGEFYLTKENVKIPRVGPIYSVNAANQDSWHPSVQRYFRDFPRTPEGKEGESSAHVAKPSARYMGALVADAHNIISNGGIFGYPGSVAKPSGKIRLLYEANPMALVFEQAGGMASNGFGRILDLAFDDIHARTPLFLGSVDNVESLQRYRALYVDQQQALNKALL
jgi:fructose-1,6-bisphosphatase I